MSEQPVVITAAAEASGTAGLIVIHHHTHGRHVPHPPTPGPPPPPPASPVRRLRPEVPRRAHR